VDFTDFIFHKVVWRSGEGVGMFSNDFITNFPQNAPVKKCWELVSIWQRYGQKFVAYFLGHPVHPCVVRYFGKMFFRHVTTKYFTKRILLQTT